MKTLEELFELRKSLISEVDEATEERFEAIQLEVKKLDMQIDEVRKGQQAERTEVVTTVEVPSVVVSGQARKQNDNDMEYRTAFMNYVLDSQPISDEIRANAITKTTDNASAIPTVVVNRIVEKMESVGMILPLVTRTMMAAGIVVPTSSVKPVATWIAEGASSDKQKKTTGSITFSNFKLRCEIAMTAEAKAISIAAFETAFVNNVAEAMIKALEEAIISGAGTASPKGILTETVPTGQTIEVSIASGITYNDLTKAEGALPLAYENGAVWCMTKKTFMDIQGMVDANKQPIARVNYGITGKPERHILGRHVVLCDYLDNLTAAGKNVAFMFNFKDYMLNTIYDMGIQSKTDWDTENYLTKAVMSVDGKVLDVNSLVVLKTKA